MDNHLTLKMLMDTLFGNNALKNWNIYEEFRSKDIILKIRFTKSQNTDHSIDSISYKKKSDKQMNRDRARGNEFKEYKRPVSNGHDISNSEIEVLRSDSLFPHSEPTLMRSFVLDNA